MDKEELKQIYASIHTLRMEGDAAQAGVDQLALAFQSTPSAWRVTNSSTGTFGTTHDFNPHPPHGG